MDTQKILTYVLVLAVLGLYILHFTSGTTETADSNVVTDTLSTSDNALKSGLIYFVNTDTVWAKYAYVQDATDKMEKRKTQYENELESKVRLFEQEVTEFQQKGPLMSEVEVQIKQRDLMRKEQELTQLRQELELKFLEEEEDWNNKLRKKIVGYIDDQTKDRDYDYILGKAFGSNIILANDSLDLTAEIVEGLNTEYNSQQSAE